MTTKTENIEATEDQAHRFEIKAYSPTLAAIEGLREKYNYIPDCSTDEGLAEVKADYRAVRKFETTLEAKRKDLGDSARKKLALINDEAKLIDSKIKEISAPLKAAFEKREAEIKEQEKKRKDKLEQKVNDLKGFENTEGMDSSCISGVIEAVTQIDCSIGFYEFTESALVVRKQILAKLGQKLNEALVQEQMTVERENLRLEREEAANLLKATELKAQAQERLNKLMMIPTGFFGKTSLEINAKINSLENYRVKEEEFGELFHQANAAKSQVIQQLDLMKTQQVMVEKSQAQAQQEEHRIAKDNRDQQQENIASGNAVAQVDNNTVSEQSPERFKETTTSVDKEVVPLQEKAPIKQRLAERFENIPENGKAEMIRQLNFWKDQYGVRSNEFADLMRIINQHAYCEDQSKQAA